MFTQRNIELSVGVFVLSAIFAFIVLALKVSGLTTMTSHETYPVTAAFDDIGQLKVRASVKIGGVVVGEVSQINIDPESYQAVVTLRIRKDVGNIPDDSSASILTAGLLGDNYIAITPMYSKTFLKAGSEIEETHSAMILEKLIGQFLFSIEHATQQNAGQNTAPTKK